MFNKVILLGNLTRDVEVRYSKGGTAIGNTGIATNRKWKDQSGEQKEEVMFIDISFFGRTAEIANKYLRKGSQILIEGRLVLDQWTSQDGTKRSKHVIAVQEMKMLDGAGKEGQHSETEHSGQEEQVPPSQEDTSTPNGTATPRPLSDEEIDEEEIPL